MSGKNNVADPQEVDFVAGTDATETEVRVKPTDPTMDPESPRWEPRKFFAAQEKEIIVVMRTASDQLDDPTNVKVLKLPVSINGYQLNVIKGRPTRVPKDFATHLIDIGAAYAYSSAIEAIE
jgi:hypothetical protein